VLAGSLRNKQTLQEFKASILWYGDFEVARLGAGEIYFCRYLLFEMAHTLPLRVGLPANLLA
jgi:hypothetical protein